MFYYINLLLKLQSLELVQPKPQSDTKPTPSISKAFSKTFLHSVMRIYQLNFDRSTYSSR